MRLTDLEARLQKHSIEPAESYHGQNVWVDVPLPPELAHIPPMKLKYIQWGGFPTHVFRTVENLAEADRISMLCPKCFGENGGKVGTHRIVVDFIGRGTPDEVCVRNDQGQPVRWELSGTCLEDMCTSPSIQVLRGCSWHGYIENGGIRTC